MIDILYRSVVIGILVGIYAMVSLFLKDISEDIHYIRTATELNTCS